MSATALHEQTLGSVGSKGVCLRMREIVIVRRLFFVFFLPARRYASAGNRDRNVSVCPSVTHRYCVKTISHGVPPLWGVKHSACSKSRLDACQKFSFRSCFGRQLLASGQDRQQTHRQQTLHTCYFWQAASADVHSTVPAHSKCAYAA